jgi:exopolyphosphatase
VRAAHRLLARLHGAAGSGGTWAAGRPLPPHATSAADLAAHARWLRADAPLPPSAHVLGATTVKALAAALLDARFDVSALSVADLLALDYKATRADGALRVGVAAVFVPLAELLRRAGGGAALADAMGKFATARGVDALLALTAADDKGAVVRNAARAADGAGADDEPTGLKGAALAPSAAGGGAAAAAVAALAAALEAAPAGLPAALLAEPLFVRQAIDLTGFGLRWEALDGAGALRVSALKRAATRKTVLPVVSYLAAQQQQPQAARADGSAEGARGRAPLS